MKRRCCLAAVLLAPAAQGQVVGWWTFEEGTPGAAPAPGASIRDISGRGHHGALSGAGAYTDGAVSAVALALPGERNRMLVADDPDFELQSGFTLETYVKFDSVAGLGDVSPLLFRGDRRGGLDPWYLAINKDGGLTIQIWDGVTVFVLNSVEQVPAGQWAHLAGTHDPAAGRMRLYINGRLIAESTGFVPPPRRELDPASSPTVAIGNSDVGAQGLDIILDSPRITARALEPGAFLPPIASCRADLNGDGLLDIFDFLEFQDSFAAGDLRADFTGDGVLDIFDFLAFQNEFAAGCP